MAEHVNGSTAGGGRPRQDPTTMPNQYPSQLPFGIGVPGGTGAPGGGGSPHNSPDPTIETLPNDVFGSPNPMKTGAPGSSGASAGVSGGAAYTDPFCHLAGNDAGQMTGGSTDTEAQADKAGHPGPFNAPYPTDTGIGHGQTLIGGRGGKNRGR